jgi:K+-transporting ATPase KdpF subunit
MPTRWAANASKQGLAMIENIVLLLISAALLVYLVYALLRPEKF